ncbi:hypothetical protein XELAEV_18025982mg [Xenopus laevis]|uniref:Uncharacterized protein n=1 Tax=Xenopus laevis TaxID=8355 RepID=A0A974D2R9_XENLA|nr:hypothetical protein XELAEV_18025982mg [Xenopus laevis]
MTLDTWLTSNPECASFTDFHPISVHRHAGDVTAAANPEGSAPLDHQVFSQLHDRNHCSLHQNLTGPPFLTLAQ